MATGGENEPTIFGMKSGLLDFSVQVGQASDESDYDFCLGYGGGDGIYFNRMMIFKRYLQIHPVAFKSFELLCAVLQGWHGE